MANTNCEELLKNENNFQKEISHYCRLRNLGGQRHRSEGRTPALLVPSQHAGRGNWWVRERKEQTGKSPRCSVSTAALCSQKCESHLQKLKKKQIWVHLLYVVEERRVLGLV